MSIPERVQAIVEKIQTSASVKTVYGEPIKANGKTIIPVAKVAYAFGMCTCGSSDEEKAKRGKEEQGCGGGAAGLAVRPAGVLEITEAETRFIPVGMGRKLAGALFIGLLLGVFIARRRSKD